MAVGGRVQTDSYAKEELPKDLDVEKKLTNWFS